MIGRSNSSNQEELVREQRRQKLHAQNNAAGGSEFSRDREYLRELTEHELDEHTLKLMSNMFSQDFVLANLTDAGENEVKWLARNVAMKIKRMHPPSESVISGESRKVFNDDPSDALKPLSPHQENLVDQAVLEFFVRLSRSRDGWQQDEISKQIRVSRTEDESDDDGRRSWFSR